MSLSVFERGSRQHVVVKLPGSVSLAVLSCLILFSSNLTLYCQSFNVTSIASGNCKALQRYTFKIAHITKTVVGRADSGTSSASSRRCFHGELTLYCVGHKGKRIKQ